jgi:hypothetical protein
MTEVLYNRRNVSTDDEANEEKSHPAIRDLYQGLSVALSF